MRIKDSDYYQQLGQRLRTLRLQRSVSQEVLAAHLKISFQQVQKYESGANRLPVDRLLDIANYLNIPASALLGAKDTPGKKEEVLVNKMLSTSRGVRLAEAYVKLPANLQVTLAELTQRAAAL